MKFPDAMMHDTVWFERPKYEEDREHYELYLTNNLTMQVSKPHEEQGLLSRATTAVTKVASSASSSLSQQINDIGDFIGKSIGHMADDFKHAVTANTDEHVSVVEKENKELHQLVNTLCEQLKKLDARVTVLEANAAEPNGRIPSSEPPAKKAKVPETEPPSKKPKVGDDDTAESKPVDSKKDEDSDSDDMFASSDEEEEDEEAAKIKAERIAKYNLKKEKKPALVAKSSLLIDVKPWDNETDMKKMEECVRTIEADGLLWGASKFVEIAYGIKKLQISAVIEDEKISTDFLEEEITKFDDYVQSMDIAAFNKI